MRARRREPLLLRERQVLGAGPEHRDALLGGQVPQDRGRREWRAVEQHHRRADGERGDQPVPHHPAARGEVEDPVVGSDIGMQRQLLQVLEQRAAGPVHHALGEPGRARGVHDAERMIERQVGVRGLVRPPVRIDQLLPAHSPRQRAEVGPRVEVGNDDDSFDSRQRTQHLAHRASESMVLPA